MKRRTLTTLLAASLLPLQQNPYAQGISVVVIGHPSLDRIDAVTVQRIFTGKTVEVHGIAVNPVNIRSGHMIRTRFLQLYLQQDEDKYVAYWTVRRYVGKGTPPKELADASDVIRFVQSTPGAIGYIDEASVTPGLNVIMR